MLLKIIKIVMLREFMKIKLYNFFKDIYIFFLDP